MHSHLSQLDLNFEYRRSLFAVVQGAVPASYLIVFTFRNIEKPTSGTEWLVENIVAVGGFSLMFFSLLVAIVLLNTHRRVTVVGSAVYHSLYEGCNKIGDVRWSGVSIAFYALTVLTFLLGLFSVMLDFGTEVWDYGGVLVFVTMLAVLVLLQVQHTAKRHAVKHVYSHPDYAGCDRKSETTKDIQRHSVMSLRNTVRDTHVVMLLGVAVYVATVSAIGQLDLQQCSTAVYPLDCQNRYRWWTVLLLSYGALVLLLTSLMLLRLRLAYEEFVLNLTMNPVKLKKNFGTRRCLDRTFLLAVVTLTMCLQFEYLLFSILALPWLGIFICFCTFALYNGLYFYRSFQALKEETR